LLPNIRFILDIGFTFLFLFPANPGAVSHVPEKRGGQSVMICLLREDDSPLSGM
jgi:hypothetical protein